MSKKNENHGKEVNKADIALIRKSEKELRAGGVPRKDHGLAAFPGDLYGSYTENWMEPEVIINETAHPVAHHRPTQ